LNWKYRDKEVLSHDDLPEGTTDIVYAIRYKDGSNYIGKKTIRSLVKKKPTKAQLAIRKNYSRKEWVNKPFVNYNGSSKLTKDNEITNKVIMYCSTNKRTATYLEAKLLFEYDALFNPFMINQNILGKFYDNSLDGLIGELT